MAATAFTSQSLPLLENGWPSSQLVRETRERVDRNANTPLLVTEFCARLRALAGK